MSNIDRLAREYNRAYWECPYCDAPLMRMRADNADIAWRVMYEHVEVAHPELS